MSKLDPKTAYRLVHDGNARLIDIREPQEWHQTGVARGATLLPQTQLDRCLGEQERRPSNQDCRSGNRSEQVRRELEARGIRVWEVEGGLLAWIEAGLPLSHPIAAERC